MCQNQYSHFKHKYADNRVRVSASLNHDVNSTTSNQQEERLIIGSDYSHQPHPPSNALENILTELQTQYPLQHRSNFEEAADTLRGYLVNLNSVDAGLVRYSVETNRALAKVLEELSCRPHLNVKQRNYLEQIVDHLWDEACPQPQTGHMGHGLCYNRSHRLTHQDNLHTPGPPSTYALLNAQVTAYSHQGAYGSPMQPRYRELHREQAHNAIHLVCASSARQPSYACQTPAPMRKQYLSRVSFLKRSESSLRACSDTSSATRGFDKWEATDPRHLPERDPRYQHPGRKWPWGARKNTEHASRPLFTAQLRTWSLPDGFDKWQPTDARHIAERDPAFRHEPRTLTSNFRQTLSSFKLPGKVRALASRKK